MMDLTLDPTSTTSRSLDPSLDSSSLATDERELMLAMLAYKQRSGRMFPTWSEVLEILIELGYSKDGSVSPRN